MNIQLKDLKRSYKPGTTGETLSILTNSLQGLDHKLHIILNKADQFRKIHDFARAYGSLCWNLSKVIDRKDLPKIYTMCLPISEDSTIQFLGEAGLNDLEQSREEVVKLCDQAPKQRIDNEISRLTTTAKNLLIHCESIDNIYNNFNSLLWKTRFIIASTTCVSAGLTWAASLLCDFVSEKESSENVKQVTVVVGSVITGISFLSTSIWQRIILSYRKKQLLQDYNPSIINIPYVKPIDILNVKRIIDNDIANLRRRAHSLFSLSDSEFTKEFSPKAKQNSYDNLSSPIKNLKQFSYLYNPELTTTEYSTGSSPFQTDVENILSDEVITVEDEKNEVESSLFADDEIIDEENNNHCDNSYQNNNCSE